MSANKRKADAVAAAVPRSRPDAKAPAVPPSPGGPPGREEMMEILDAKCMHFFQHAVHRYCHTVRIRMRLNIRHI